MWAVMRFDCCSVRVLGDGGNVICARLSLRCFLYGYPRAYVMTCVWLSLLPHCAREHRESLLVGACDVCLDVAFV